ADIASQTNANGSDDAGAKNADDALKQKQIDNNTADPIRFPEVKAEFPGGEKALMKWLGDNLSYPDDALDSNLQGVVVVEFVVKADGSIGDVKFLKTASPSLDREAVRLVEAMPRWKPAKSNGTTVSSYFSLPVMFVLQQR
ncbi:MAG: energy transducer TonB, partial [Bacteroidales bacterium]|nr:energy transducer TonB [Bacteroidales bacterium]